MTTTFISETMTEIDRASFQAVDRRISVLFLHRTNDRRSLYTVETTGGKMLKTNVAPKIPFTDWVVRTISELLSASELQK